MKMDRASSKLPEHDINGEYFERKPEKSRTTMPQIANTSHVALSTKYSQANISKLSTAKSKL